MFQGKCSSEVISFVFLLWCSGLTFQTHHMLAVTINLTLSPEAIQPISQPLLVTVPNLCAV